METARDALRVSLVQCDSTHDVEENLAVINNQVAACADESDLIVLPELCCFRGDMKQYAEIAEPIEGTLSKHVTTLARTHATWILLGSFAERDGDSVYNSSVLFAPTGERTAVYRKIHLFGIELNDGTTVNESAAYTAGAAPCATHIHGWQTGLSICYDLRFPELFRSLSNTGMDMILAPSDFTATTGKAHWETLCRSRAIENQCYLVAANQCGHNRVTGLASYGHSMIVDPWGEILAQAGDQPCTLQATLSKERIQSVRQQLPALKDRRLN
ncbi:MAG: carbon-nitrogen hydrolase family protein [Kiritimatiellae bacterium]|nr:carbon-nitrogen hydrolase family protein [Kiritimatiellia bacterium]